MPELVICSYPQHEVEEWLVVLGWRASLVVSDRLLLASLIVEDNRIASDWIVDHRGEAWYLRFLGIQEKNL